jgi:hypothetical protein
MLSVTPLSENVELVQKDKGRRHCRLIASTIICGSSSGHGGAGDSLRLRLAGFVVNYVYNLNSLNRNALLRWLHRIYFHARGVFINVITVKQDRKPAMDCGGFFLSSATATGRAAA